MWRWRGSNTFVRLEQQIICRLMLSKQDRDFRTPDDFFETMSKTYGPFDIDVAASSENARCERFWSREDDGLKQAWLGRVWCNPPYGKGIQKWIGKAVEEVNNGHAQTVVMLIPAHTGTIYFHDLIWSHASEILLIKRRLSFSGPFSKHGTGRFYSMVAVFRAGGDKKQLTIGTCERDGRRIQSVRPTRAM